MTRPTPATGGYQAANDPRSGVCKHASCRARLLWAETATGRRMPLNPGPDDNGNVALVLRPERPLDLAVVLTADKLDTARARGDQLYTPHFATCPAVAGKRRGRRR